MVVKSTAAPLHAPHVPTLFIPSIPADIHIANPASQNMSFDWSLVDPLLLALPIDNLGGDPTTVEVKLSTSARRDTNT
jgi:hypothetical protein